MSRCVFLSSLLSPFSPPFSRRVLTFRALKLSQIVLYVVSRVVSSLLPRAQLPPSSASKPPSIPLAPSSKALTPPGYPYPKSIPPDSAVFKVYAAIAWGAVMWLFSNKRERLNGGMVNSMQYLYLDSEVWSGLKDFLWREWPCPTLVWVKAVVMGHADLFCMFLTLQITSRKACI